MTPPDSTYESSGHTELFINSDGTLHSNGAAVPSLKQPAVVDASALPAADPHVAGHLWVNAGVLTRSAG